MQTGAGNANKICVFSASGSVGFDLCKCLLNQNLPFKACVKKGTRNDKKVQDLHSFKEKDTKGLIEIVEVDWSQLDSIKKALHGCDRVFLKCPIGQCENASRNFVECLKDCKTIKWMVDFSVFDAEESKSNSMGSEFLKGEQLLQSCGIPFCIVRPSILFSNFLFDSKSIKERGEICRPLGNARINVVSDLDVAEAVCKLLLNESKNYQGKNLHLFGKECINMNDFANLLSKELNKQITYREVSEDEFAKCLREHGISREGIESYLGMMRLAKEGGYDKNFDDLKNLLGREPCGIRECLQKCPELLQ